MTTPTPSWLPYPYTVCHIARTIGVARDPDTGNQLFVDQPPVLRKVQSITVEDGKTEQVISAEYLRRTIAELILVVQDPIVYASDDQVLLFPEIDSSGNYVPGTGLAFFVIGLPADDWVSPWPAFTRMFGGTVRIRRAT